MLKNRYPFVPVPAVEYGLNGPALSTSPARLRSTFIECATHFLGRKFLAHAGLPGRPPIRVQTGLIMKRTLRRHADFEAIQKEARKLLRALQQRDAAATERYQPFDILDRTSHARLADAQYIVARRYGFRSWANLREHLIVPRNFT